MKNIILGFISVLIISCGPTRKIKSRTIDKQPNLKYYELSSNAALKGTFIAVNDRGEVKILSEVSPDAMVTAITNLTTKLKGNIFKKADITAENAASITESVTQLGKRTVSVSILRDALYRLEEMQVNGKLDEQSIKVFNRILNIADTIALAEIETEKTKQEQEETKQLQLSEVRKKPAYQWKIKGFNFLLNNNDIKNAIDAFHKGNTISPLSDYNGELESLIDQNKDNLTKDDPTIWKKVAKTILENYADGLPDNIISKLNQLAK